MLPPVNRSITYPADPVREYLIITKSISERSYMQRLTLATICQGALQERVDRAIAKVVDNILDPNTDAKKKRTIQIAITFVPNEDDREDVSVMTSTTVKLVPEEGISTQMFLQKDLTNGHIVATEHKKGTIKGQLTLDEMGLSVDEHANTAEELKCDPETGEVLNMRAL